MSADFSTETLQAGREGHEVFKVMKGKNLQPRILYPARLSFRYDGEVKSFPDKQVLRDSAPPNHLYMLKELLQTGNTREGKNLENTPKRKWK